MFSTKTFVNINLI